jgi:hypothetical protein
VAVPLCLRAVKGRAPAAADQAGAEDAARRSR